MASSVNIDPSDFEDLIRRTIKETIRETESRRPKDSVGRVLLTKAEAAEAMGVSEKTIDRWRSERGLPHLKLDTGKPMFRPESLREWAAENDSSLAIGG